MSKALMGCLGLLTVSSLAGCSDAGSGTATIFLEAEETITDGLVPGTDEENIVDGWTVSYAQFVVSIGDVRLARSATASEVRDDEVLVIDLASLPSSGHTLTSFSGLAAARWDQLGYATPTPTVAATRDPSVSQEDFDRMVAEGCTYLVAGTISQPESSDVSFTLCVPAPTTFTNCTSPDGMPGLAIPAGGTTTGSLTIHGDHMWFDAFPSGGEGTIERRASWLADCDLDMDGNVTADELASTPAAELFTTARGYSLAGAPIPIDDAWDWVVAQLATQGHFQGEGECVYAL